MHRILMDQARRKQDGKRGGQGRRVPLDFAEIGSDAPADELLDIDDALTRLAGEEPQAARLIQLRYFAGLSIEDATEVVGISRSTAYEHWSYARARLETLLGGSDRGDRNLFLFVRTDRPPNTHCRWRNWGDE